MKNIIFVLLCFWIVSSSAQIRITGVSGGVNIQQYNNDTLYIIKDVDATAPFGEIVFTPGDKSGWVYQWTYNGAPQTYTYPSGSDSSNMRVNIIGDGFYTLTAEHDSVAIPVYSQFHVFFNHLPEIVIGLADAEDCEMVKITIEDIESPLYNGTFPGAENIIYTVVWDGYSRDLTPATSYNYDSIPQMVSGFFKDVKCHIKIKDRFGFEWESNEVDYVSVLPSSKIKIDITDPIAEKAGEAPLQVHFEFAGENAHDWEWLLYKDTTDLIVLPEVTLRDSLLDEMSRYGEGIDYIYEHPGYYGAKLVATNTRGINRCTDTSALEYIIVYNSLVDVPNVFTPNGDGINDLFRVKTQSLEWFHGVIVNRWERKVFEWTNPEEGWDGRINGKYASPGTYYYIIRAKGREKNAPPNYTKKGALLLVR
ncbi:gliding motility-associated C-terminal domain-containing protein [Odoribacter sp. OttesenSCG-928-G04]|nr:gliding motility-associated C-terminal domain-containing protein [Odoribacter sp. OttesenSCG-928-G04]